MGQIALGFRSLVIKLAIFFAMAALLAWALGGTLFPRPEEARLSGVRFGGVEWCWRLSVGGREEGALRWHLLRIDKEGKAELADDHDYAEAAGPVSDGQALFYAGRGATDSRWTLVRIDTAGAEEFHLVMDRLAVERQFARVESGLPIQDTATERAIRATVIDPKSSEPGPKPGAEPALEDDGKVETTETPTGSTPAVPAGVEEASG